MNVSSPKSEHPLTPRDVVRIVGEVDDLVISRILGTGATEAELREAADEADAELVEGTRVPPASNQRVATLRAVLADVLADSLEPDDRD